MKYILEPICSSSTQRNNRLIIRLVINTIEVEQATYTMLINCATTVRREALDVKDV